jgi:hypothetical protein
MAGKGIVINISGSGEGAAEALRQIEAKMLETQARAVEMQTQLAASGERVQRAFGDAVPQVAAASGAIRELEGNLPIRAVERFLTGTLGLGPALQAAFPVVGAIALAGVLARMGEELFKFGKDATELSERLGTNWLQAAVSQIVGVSDEIKKADAETLKWGEDFDKIIARMKKRAIEDITAKEGPSTGAAFEANQLQQKISADRQRIADLQSQVQLQSQFISSRTSKAPTQPGDFERSQDLLHRVQKAGLSDNEDVAKAQMDAAKEEIKARQAEIAETQQQSTDKVLASLKKEEEAYDRVNHANAKGDRTALGSENRNASIDGSIDRYMAEQAKKDEEQANQLVAAQLRLTEAGENAELEVAKSAGSLRLALLDSEHKAGTVSEQSYLRQRLALVNSENSQEVAAAEKKRATLQLAIAAEGKSDTPRKLQLEAQLVELDARLTELANTRAGSEAQITAEMQNQAWSAQVKAAQQAITTRHTQEEKDARIAALDRSGDAQEDKLNVEGARAATQAAGSFFTQLSEGAIKGKLSMKSLVDSAIMDLDRFAMKLMEERALVPLMNSLFGIGGGNASSILASAMNGPNANGSSLTPIETSTYSDWGPIGDAGGGDLNDGGWAVVGDGGDGSGSELFAPKGPGTVLPHDVLEGLASAKGGSGGAPNVTVNTINNSSNPVQQKQAGVSWDGQARQFIIHTVLEDMQQGGPMSAAMQGFAPK